MLQFSEQYRMMMHKAREVVFHLQSSSCDAMQFHKLLSTLSHVACQHDSEVVAAGCHGCLVHLDLLQQSHLAIHQAYQPVACSSMCQTSQLVWYNWATLATLHLYCLGSLIVTRQPGSLCLCQNHGSMVVGTFFKTAEQNYWLKPKT